jgi:hypothetical protein
MSVLIINDLLCFAVNKLGRMNNKQLKSVINDFYSPDDINIAKELIVNEVDKLLLDKWHKPARRRKDSINRVNLEIDDLLNVISVVDNNKILDKLPVFVSSDPDKMPTIKLTDGDLSVLLIKIQKLEDKIDENNATIRLDIDEVRSVVRKGTLVRTLQEGGRSEISCPQTCHLRQLIELLHQRGLKLMTMRVLKTSDARSVKNKEEYRLLQPVKKLKDHRTLQLLFSLGLLIRKRTRL